MLMTFPPPALFIAGYAAREHRKAEVRLVSRTRRHSSRVRSWTGFRMLVPALLTRMSRRPSRSMVAFVIASTDASLVTSTSMAIAVPPRRSISVAAARDFSRFRAATTIWAPAAASPILFRQALDRAARLIEPDQLFAVVARDHRAYYDTELSEFPGVRRILQPAYRGSAPELFLPVLRIAAEDPHATVVVVPSGQLVDGEARLMAYVGRAAQAVERRPDLVVVIGAHPLGLEVPCTWSDPR